MKSRLCLLAVLFLCFSSMLWGQGTSSTKYGKIPIDSKRWYQLNSQGVDMVPLFDNKIPAAVINRLWNGQVKRQNWDAYYALLPGEEMTIDSIKLFSIYSAPSLKIKSWKIYVSDTNSTGNTPRKLIAEFTNGWGDSNNQIYPPTWVGPNPLKNQNDFALDTSAKNFRFLIFNFTADEVFPQEVEFYGTYKAPNPFTPSPLLHYPLTNYLGGNGSESDYIDDGAAHKVNPILLEAALNFKGFRHYLDWERLQEYQYKGLSFNPTSQSSRNYDTMYKCIKDSNQHLIVTLQDIPGWLQNKYDSSIRQSKLIPIDSPNCDRSKPESYKYQAKAAFQFAARYGRTTVPDSLLDVYPDTLYKNTAGANWNKKRTGLGTVLYFEAGNERDIFWKDSFSYQTGREYAANLSAFYDGHKGALTDAHGNKVYGVKQADPTMKVVMAGLASPNTDYVRGMIDWCRENRGYRANGTIDLAWDVINYHHYATDYFKYNDGLDRFGIAPELSKLDSTAKAFLYLSKRFADNMPVWVTETGYSTNSYSNHRPDTTTVTGKTKFEMIADWTLRTILLYSRNGIEKLYLYSNKDHNPGDSRWDQTCGLLEKTVFTDTITKQAGFTKRRPAANFIVQLSKTFGTYIFDSTLSKAPYVDLYKDSAKQMYAMVNPTQTGTSVNYSISLGRDSAIIYRPQYNDTVMQQTTVATPNGILTLVVGETPCFVVPIGNPAQLNTACLAIPSKALVILDTIDVNRYINFSSANDWYIPSSIIIPSNTTVTFKDAVVAIENGATIIVRTGATLNIKGCHFLNCKGLWGGIIVETGGKVNIDGSATNSTLIEDAATAIFYDDESSTPSTNGNIIDINNTIFNRNTIGIDIRNFNGNQAGDSIYPFSIKNSIFTSRNIAASVSSSWDNVETIKSSGRASASYPNTPLSYGAPYISDNTYQVSLLKNADSGYSNAKPKAGILLNNVAGYDSLGNRGGIVIGDDGDNSHPNTTVFDNLGIGISATQTNLRLRNCTFQNAASNGSAGVDIHNEVHKIIHSQNTFGNVNIAQNLNDYAIDISTTAVGQTPNNAFFDLPYGVLVNGGIKTNIANCDIRSTQEIGKNSDEAKPGSFGIYYSSNYYDSASIIGNHIYNVRNAIVVNNSLDDEPMKNIVVNYGSIAVNGNNIANQLPGASNTGEEYVENGIVLSALQMLTENNKSKSNIQCKYDTLTNVFNGIKVSNWIGKNTIVEANNIQLAPDKLNGNNDDYGISLEAGTGDGSDHYSNKVVNNIVTGYGMNSNTSGIMLSQQSNTEVGCNTVSSFQHGFRFIGNNPETKFWDNTMKTDNKYGFTLKEDGAIGLQGTYDTVNNLYCTSDNNWVEGAAYWNKNLSNQYMTNCDNSDPMKSILVVRDTTLHPEINPNGSGNFYTGYFYQNSSDPSISSIIYAQSTPTKCPRCTSLVYKQTNFDIRILEEIAQGIIELPIDDAEKRLYVMQEQLYKLVKTYPDLVMHSANLQQFIYDNQWTSMDFIHFAGKYLAEGNISVVETLLGSWPGTEELDKNYLIYFEWMIRITKDPEWKPEVGQMNQLYELANRCPIKSGIIIYAFRNLYNALTNRINRFEETCGGEMARGTKPKGFIRLHQSEPPKTIKQQTKSNAMFGKLTIFPNPANKQITISGKNLIQVVITNIFGKIVLNKNVNISSQITLDVNYFPAGLYFVKVKNLEGKAEIQKLFVN